MTPAKEEQLTPEEQIVTQFEFRQLQRDLDTERRVNVTLAVGSQDKGKRIDELEAEVEALKAELAQSVTFGAQELGRYARVVMEKDRLRKALEELDKHLDFGTPCEDGQPYQFDDASGINRAYKQAQEALGEERTICTTRTQDNL